VLIVFQLSDVAYSWLGLHPTVLIPDSAPTPRYVTRPNSPTLQDEDNESADAASLPDLHLQAAGRTQHDRRERLKSVLRHLIRVVFAVLAIIGALVMPSFEAVLSLLGSGFGIVSIVIIPICAYGQIFGWRWYHFAICAVSGVFGVAGTWAAFMVDSAEGAA
jgi:vesicular inhibitory amino acid transporter